MATIAIATKIRPFVEQEIIQAFFYKFHKVTPDYNDLYSFSHKIAQNDSDVFDLEQI